MSHPVRRRARVSIRTVTLLALAAGTTAAWAEPGRVEQTVYLREGPGTDYRPLDEAQRGREAEILGCRDGWCRIRLGDVGGYVPDSAFQPVLGQAGGPPDRCFVSRQAGYKSGREQQVCYGAGPKP